MTNFKTALFAGCVLFGAAAASAASASTVIITDVQAGYNEGSLTKVTEGRTSEPWATPLVLTDSTGQTMVVFCDDLQHDVTVTNNQNLSYHTGLVTVNGLGQALTETVSNEMGQLAGIGQSDYSQHNAYGAIAAQAEIWALEYGTTASSANWTIEADIRSLANALHDNGDGWATGLIADNGTQSFVSGLEGPVGGVPEPATWALLILGIGMIGAAARRRGVLAAAAVQA